MEVCIDEVRAWLAEVSQELEPLGTDTKVFASEADLGQDPCLTVDFEVADGTELFLAIWSMGRYEAHLANPKEEKDHQFAFASGYADSSDGLIDALSPWIDRFRVLIS